MKFFSLAILLVLALGGCSLNGDRPLDQLARLQTHYHWTYSGRTGASNFQFHVESVDGRPVPEDIDTMRLKPGKHRLVVSCQNRAAPGSNPETVRLEPTLKAGIRYIPGQDSDESDCAPAILNSKAPFRNRNKAPSHSGVFDHG